MELETRELPKAGKRATIACYDDGTASVTVGPFASGDEARAAADKLRGGKRSAAHRAGRVVGWSLLVSWSTIMLGGAVLIVRELVQWAI